VTVFCFHLLESRRRGVSRSDDPQSVFPRDFNFADQINSTCHYFVETSFYTTEDYHATIQILRSTIDDIQAELNIDCGSSTLSTLSLSTDDSLASLHHSLSSVLAHLYVMKIDWLQSRGLSCTRYRKLMAIRDLHIRLIDTWRELTCMFVSSINFEINESLRTSVNANIASILKSPILKYRNCRHRTMRDCSLLSQSESVIEIFFSSISRRTVVV